jgi:uncharacterized protein YceH (UPF0502 family)
VNKYRHAAYEWLGVDAAGAAVMAELLLRGPQTAGELRARAARMHDFADLDGMVTLIDQLRTAGLVQALSPPGRGQIFAHSLYPPDEQQYLGEKVSSSAETEPLREHLGGGNAPDNRSEHDLRERVTRLETEVEELKRRLDQLTS